jgi:hypothetical protein
LNFEQRPARYFPAEFLENLHSSFRFFFIARVSSFPATLLFGPITDDKDAQMNYESGIGLCR